jgi:hypothetical protein
MLTYRPVRSILFDVQFSLPRRHGRIAWTPCREEAAVDPQAEGIVIASSQGSSTLHVYSRRHRNAHLGSFRVDAVALALDDPLRIDPSGYDPRAIAGRR